MANTGFKGIDVLQTGTAIVFRFFLQSSAGALVTTGTTNLYLYELQSDGSLKSYDWSSNTFKATALTTETQALTHQTGNNSTTNTGLWTYALATLTGFTVGGVYMARCNNSSASPADQERFFQYGGYQGDVAVTAGATGVAYLQADAIKVGGTTQTARDLGASVLLSPGTGTGQISLTSGAVTAGTVNDKTGYSLTTTPPTAAAIATAVWQDTTAGDFANVGSPGKILVTQLGGAFTTTSSSVFTTGSLVNGPVGATATAIATAVWQDLTSGSDFTTVSSIGKLLTTNLDTNVNSRLASGNVTIGGYAAGQDPATLVLDVLGSFHNTANTIGAKINSSGAAADPWNVSLPGSYSAGTAGYIMGTNVDARVTSRQASGNVTVGAYAGGQDPASLVLNAATGTYITAGSIGAAIGNAGSAGDPWASALPGAYGAGTAGFIIGNRLDINVGSRVATSGYTAPPSTSAIAAAILLSPSHLLATDASGYVTLASAGLDQIAVETGVNARQMLALVGSTCAGLASGLSTNTPSYKAVNNPGTTRVSGTTDSDGERLSLTYNLP